MKVDTNLFDIAKCKTMVSAIEVFALIFSLYLSLFHSLCVIIGYGDLQVSADGFQFATTSPDRRIRVFWYRSGKLRRVYDESLEVSFLYPPSLCLSCYLIYFV